MVFTWINLDEHQKAESCVRFGRAWVAKGAEGKPFFLWELVLVAEEE